MEYDRTNISVGTVAREAKEAMPDEQLFQRCFLMGINIVEESDIGGGFFIAYYNGERLGGWFTARKAAVAACIGFGIPYKE